MLRLVSSLLAVSVAAGFVPASQQARPARSELQATETLEDLKALQLKLCPVVPYFDPLELGSADLFGDSQNVQWKGKSTIGWIRHAEIKHGRVAMAAFVGYLVQAKHFAFTFDSPFNHGGDSQLSPPEQWDALSLESKWNIILFVGLLEFFGENFDISGQEHYMAGGVPGKYPTPPAWPLKLWDPLGMINSWTPERKEKALRSEINNGRLAMIGIMSFLAESKLPGSVPFLAAMQGTPSEVKPYAGDYMAPFASNFGMSAHDIADPFANFVSLSGSMQ